MESSVEVTSVEVTPVPSKPSRGVRKVKAEEGNLVKSDEFNLGSDVGEEELSLGSHSEGEMNESWGGAQVAPETLGGSHKTLGASLADELLAADPTYLANTGDTRTCTHTHTHTHACTHTHTHAHTHTHVHAHLRTRTHTRAPTFCVL